MRDDGNPVMRSGDDENQVGGVAGSLNYQNVSQHLSEPYHKTGIG